MLKEIPSLPGYFCNEIGEIFSNRANHPPDTKPMTKIKTRIDRYGYETFCVFLRGENKRKYPTVHRKVLEAFHGNPLQDQMCNHKNGIRNDNRIENLEWVSAKENKVHSIEVLGNNVNGEGHKGSKITEQDVLEIRKLRANGLSYSVIGKKFGLHLTHIRRITMGKRWAHVKQ